MYFCEHQFSSFLLSLFNDSRDILLPRFASFTMLATEGSRSGLGDSYAAGY
jgi:hypothetical protein